MNPYTVDWDDDAIDELTLIWLEAADQHAVNQAQVAIDALLAQSPLLHGKPMSEGLRSLTVEPLRVFYSVDSTARTVEVSRVWLEP